AMTDTMRELLNAALTRTEKGRLVWKAFNDETFRVAVGSGHLHIERTYLKTEDDDGDTVPVVSYSVRVSDAQGRVVEEEDVAPGAVRDDFALIDGLFRAARKSALGTD